MGKFLVFILLIMHSEPITTNVINKSVGRLIDLTSQLVKISSTISIENAGADVVSNYLVYLKPDNGSLCHVSVKYSTKHELRIYETKSDEEMVYSIELKQPLRPGKSVDVVVEIVYANALGAYPINISQSEQQLVRYFGNHYFYSPYNTTKQTTTVILNTKNIESYTPLRPHLQKDYVINYGPYSNVEPLSRNQMMIHYENNAPFLAVTQMQRSIQISHWGNIAVQETINVLHTGAKLVSPFSRYDYQHDKSSTHHYINSYFTILPAAAHNIYYHDVNGNILSSKIRERKDWIELELRARFPLFGGWRSSYTLGYNMPSYQCLFRLTNDRFKLKIRVLDHVYDDMHVRALQTSIFLPLGAHNVIVHVPYEIDRLPDTTSYKYLDFVGRTVINLRKQNLVEQHIQDVEIVYDWNPYVLFYEPILLSAAILPPLLIVILYNRIDFSIV